MEIELDIDLLKKENEEHEKCIFIHKYYSQMYFLPDDKRSY